MSVYPEAVWRPLPENETQPAIEPDQVVLHTAVDHPGPTNLRGFFDQDGVTVESHFWVRFSGKVEQFIDTNIRADANYRGNSRAISIETEDDGNPEGRPWTREQVAAIVDILLWCHREHDIPLEVMPVWNEPGIGWHSMWGFSDRWNLVSPLVNPWTPSLGKTCPGRTRIHQIYSDVLPELRRQQAAQSSDDELVARLRRRVQAQNRTIGNQSAKLERFRKIINDVAAALKARR